MKSTRLILLTAFITIAIFSLVSYTACKKDSCANVVCLHLGACDGGNCICKVGFEGTRCETLSRDKFIFTFNGSDSCGRFGTHQYPINFTAMLDDPREMTMKNILDDVDDSAVCTIQAVDSFTFIGANNATTYRGWGTLRHDSLHMRFHVDQDTSSYDCSYFGLGLR
jgi:hypothetical protein